jgi:hypothetical protein
MAANYYQRYAGIFEAVCGHVPTQEDDWDDTEDWDIEEEYEPLDISPNDIPTWQSQPVTEQPATDGQMMA